MDGAPQIRFYGFGHIDKTALISRSNHVGFHYGQPDADWLVTSWADDLSMEY